MFFLHNIRCSIRAYRVLSLNNNVGFFGFNQNKLKYVFNYNNKVCYGLFFTIKVFVQFKAYYYLIFLLSFFNEKCLHDTHNIYYAYLYVCIYDIYTYFIWEIKLKLLFIKARKFALYLRTPFSV